MPVALLLGKVCVCAHCMCAHALSFSGDRLHRCGILRQVVWGDVLHTLLKENARNRALKVFVRECCPEQTLRKQMRANTTLPLQEEAYVHKSLFCIPNTSHFREALITIEQYYLHIRVHAVELAIRRLCRVQRIDFVAC